VKNFMNTGTNSQRIGTDLETELGAPRQAFDSLKPVEIQDSAPVDPLEHELAGMRQAVAAQRKRAAVLGGGALAAVAALGFGLFGLVSAQEEARAHMRVQSHLAAAAAAPPPAAMELPKAVEPAKEPEAPAPKVSEIPKNGGTPAWVLVAPGDRNKATLRRKK